MIPNPPAMAVRVDPLSRPATDLDRYLRSEYPGSTSAWYLSQTPPTSRSRPRRRRPHGDRFLRRAARAIATFLF